jgi:hypothetical protein
MVPEICCIGAQFAGQVFETPGFDLCRARERCVLRALVGVLVVFGRSHANLND